jgi:hypothetical protein
MKTHPDIEGIEFDWFATDRAGNIALFATAGAGFVPKAVVSARAKHEAISESFETPNWGSEKVWDDYASLGIFVFDWTLHDGPYRLVRAPTSHIGTQLYATIRGISSLQKLAVDFHESKCISEGGLANDT